MPKDTWFTSFYHKQSKKHINNHKALHIVGEKKDYIFSFVNFNTLNWDYYHTRLITYLYSSNYEIKIMFLFILVLSDQYLSQILGKLYTPTPGFAFN